MQTAHPDQEMAVFNHLRAVAEKYPQAWDLLAESSAIAEELAAQDKFQRSNGRWVLSDMAFQTWFLGHSDAFLRRKLHPARGRGVLAWWRRHRR